MQKKLFYTSFILMFGFYVVQGQCDFMIPPSVKKIDYAKREITFSDVTINGLKTKSLSVAKGQPIVVETMIKSKKNGNYCPSCIVQVYWGIKDHASVCAKSFGGYRFSKQKSIQRFRAPNKDGIYYITFGGSLEYSCKNSLDRPECSPKYAFAVLKVGTPEAYKKVVLEKTERGSDDFLKTSLQNSGCYGKLDKIEWFYNGSKISKYDNQKEIKLIGSGVYTVFWSNCVEKISKTYNYYQENISNEKKQDDVDATQDDDIEELIKKKNNFTLKNLVFYRGKSSIIESSTLELNKLAKVMLDNPSLSILLEGHTDYRGNARNNLKLSERRVKAVKKYLISRGVSRKNIHTIGLGERKPLIVDQDIEKCKINRRVEVRVLSR